MVVVTPYALVSNTIDEHRQNVREEETWKRWKAGDPPVVAECVIDCRLPLHVTAAFISRFGRSNMRVSSLGRRARSAVRMAADQDGSMPMRGLRHA